MTNKQIDSSPLLLNLPSPVKRPSQCVRDLYQGSTTAALDILATQLDFLRYYASPGFPLRTTTLLDFSMLYYAAGLLETLDNL